MIVGVIPIDTITGIHIIIIMLGYTYINQQYYSTVEACMIVYYIIVVVRYIITSISYNTNTGKILCIAPDGQYRIYGLYPSCLLNIITLISTFVLFTSVDYNLSIVEIRHCLPVRIQYVCCNT